MALFVEHISTLSADITSVLKSKVTEWIASQAIFIQALLEISAGKVELLKNLSPAKLMLAGLITIYYLSSSLSHSTIRQQT